MKSENRREKVTEVVKLAPVLLTGYISSKAVANG